jgi:hypothetical protein
MYKSYKYLTFIPFILSAHLFAGCDGVTDSLEEALTAEPQKSTCQAYCEWAVSCHGQARELDEESTMEACLSETKAVNTDCEVMETEGINTILSDIYKGCTDAIDAERTENNCAPFTGDTIEVNSSIAPTECALVAADDVDVFNTARMTTAEDNDALCERMSVTLCQRSTSCLVSEFNIPQSYLDELMPNAEEQCITQFEESVTSSCKDNDLYSISSEEGKADEAVTEIVPTVLFSVNPSREAARACLLALAELACGDFFGGNLPPECAGAFSDPVSTIGVVNNFACGLERPELDQICTD